jgi:hypothetical protein
MASNPCAAQHSLVGATATNRSKFGADSSASRLLPSATSSSSCELEMHTVDVATNGDWTENNELSVKELASVCRGKLSSIRRSSYLCRDADTLRQLARLLSQAEEYINWNLTSDVCLAPAEHVDDDYDDADFACDSLPSSKRRRRPRGASAKRRKLRAADGEREADAESSEGGAHVEFTVLNTDSVTQLIDSSQPIELTAADTSSKQQLVEDAQPIIHLLFVDRDSDVTDEQYTELTNEQLATLVSASFQQQGVAT